MSVFSFVGKYCPIYGPHAFKIAYPGLAATVGIAPAFFFGWKGVVDRVEHAWAIGPNVQAGL